jgi:hypothetical protein
MKRTTKTDGTSLKGYITASRKELVEVFGEPCLFEPSTMEKVQIEWCLEFGDGTVATIYDWKQYGHIPPEDEIVDWNVGGHSAKAMDQVLAAIG